MIWIHAVHVITKNDTLEGGNIPDAQITAQMNVLNADYAKTGLSFNLVSTTRTRNESWFNDLGPDSYVVISPPATSAHQRII